MVLGLHQILDISSDSFTQCCWHQRNIKLPYGFDSPHVVIISILVHCMSASFTSIPCLSGFLIGWSEKAGYSFVEASNESTCSVTKF